MIRILSFILIVFFAFSCSTPRNLVFFSDIQDTSVVKSKISQIGSPKIQPGDILAIKVSSLSPESNILFNSGALPQVDPGKASLGAYAGGGGINSMSSGLGTEGYQVDTLGNIHFPVLGKVTVANLTKEAAQVLIVKELTKFVKDPIVNVRFLNFKVTVIGEVNRPSTFTVDNEKINVLEALGMAGDMTMYGKRENVLLIREQGNERTLVRLDLNKSSTFNSPYFQLQQNDIVYVEPDKMKERQASTNVRTISLLASFTTVLIVAISRLL